jgi:hypothetical protein
MERQADRKGDRGKIAMTVKVLPFTCSQTVVATCRVLSILN